jgi:hypothetical protein
MPITLMLTASIGQARTPLQLNMILSSSCQPSLLLSPFHPVMCLPWHQCRHRLHLHLQLHSFRHNLLQHYRLLHCMHAVPWLGHLNHLCGYLSLLHHPVLRHPLLSSKCEESAKKKKKSNRLSCHVKSWYLQSPNLVPPNMPNQLYYIHTQVLLAAGPGE